MIINDNYCMGKAWQDHRYYSETIHTWDEIGPAKPHWDDGFNDPESWLVMIDIIDGWSNGTHVIFHQPQRVVLHDIFFVNPSMVVS